MRKNVASCVRYFQEPISAHFKIILTIHKYREILFLQSQLLRPPAALRQRNAALTKSAATRFQRQLCQQKSINHDIFSYRTK